LLGKQQRQFVVFEADQIEVVVGITECLDLEPEHFVVPAGVQREFVIGENQRPALVLREAIDDDNWHFRHAELPRRQEAAVTRNDDGVASGKDRIYEAEFFNGRGVLCNLLLAVRARVACIRDERVDVPVFDVACHWHKQHRTA
jgi:hypothetical protein